MIGWGIFATITGGAAAALTGLLFVAVSIRVEVIYQSVALRNRGARTLTQFGAVIGTAAVLTIPGQPLPALGAEVIALALAAGVTLWLLDRRSGRDYQNYPAYLRAIDAASPDLLTSLALVAAGSMLAAGLHSGLYVLAGPMLSGLFGGVNSAWRFLTRIPADLSAEELHQAEKSSP